MRRLALISLLFVASCAGRDSIPGPTLQNPPNAGDVGEDRSTLLAPEPSSATAVPAAPLIRPTATPQRTNWLLLGGDYRAHRAGTAWGDKTDVMILVSVLETDPLDIAVVQFPRNLYVPVAGMEDMWLFAVWGREGWQGLHNYFLGVFDVPLQGILYVDMDSFEAIVDGLGGISPVTAAGIQPMSGAEALGYLRDNDNQWERGSYDFEQRSFRVLDALWLRGFDYLREDPVGAVDLARSRWGGLVRSDMANVRQFYWLAELAYRVGTSDKDVRFIQLEEPFVLRDDTPLEVRGMVPQLDLRFWMGECVLAQKCVADP